MDDLVRAVEATLFAAEAPMTAEAISAHLGGADVRAALDELAAHYRLRGVALVARGNRWHFQTAPDLAHLLRREREDVRRLSRAATEVLAIVAYHEPVSRAEIESIRGVQTAKGTLDVLMEAGWVRITGRREVPGRPVIYATTPDFLTHFGLESSATCRESMNSAPPGCSIRSKMRWPPRWMSPVTAMSLKIRAAHWKAKTKAPKWVPSEGTRRPSACPSVQE